MADTNNTYCLNKLGLLINFFNHFVAVDFLGITSFRYRFLLVIITIYRVHLKTIKHY